MKAIIAAAVLALPLFASAQTVALYHFDGSVGEPAGSITDSGPNALTGSISGTATYATGAVGTSLDLTGDLDFVSIPNSSALTLTNSWTVELFLKPNSPYVTYGSDGSYVVTKLHTASAGNRLSSFAISFSVNGHIYGEISPGQDAGVVLDSGSARNFHDGQWHHVALVFNTQAENGKTISLYVDYELRAAAVVTFPAIAWANFPLYLGAGNFPGGQSTSSFRRNFDGKIDEFRITSAALPPDQFLQVEFGRFGLLAIAPATASAVQISWPTASTQSYQLQYHTELGPTTGWKNLFGPFEGTGASLQTPDTILNVPARFYRVIESP